MKLIIAPIKKSIYYLRTYVKNSHVTFIYVNKGSQYIYLIYHTIHILFYICISYDILFIYA